MQDQEAVLQPALISIRIRHEGMDLIKTHRCCVIGSRIFYLNAIIIYIFYDPVIVKLLDCDAALEALSDRSKPYPMIEIFFNLIFVHCLCLTVIIRNRVVPSVSGS